MSSIDCWNQIEDLEELGLTKEATDLTELYNSLFVDYCEIRYKTAYNYFKDTYGYVPNCFVEL